jgi:hypothetical protein
MNRQPSLEDELDSLADLLKLNLDNTDDPDFFGKFFYQISIHMIRKFLTLKKFIVVFK